MMTATQMIGDIASSNRDSTGPMRSCCHDGSMYWRNPILRTEGWLSFDDKGHGARRARAAALRSQALNAGFKSWAIVGSR